MHEFYHRGVVIVLMWCHDWPTETKEADMKNVIIKNDGGYKFMRGVNFPVMVSGLASKDCVLVSGDELELAGADKSQMIGSGHGWIFYIGKEAEVVE